MKTQKPQWNEAAFKREVERSYQGKTIPAATIIKPASSKPIKVPNKTREKKSKCR
jgi:hypothetical protein